MRALLLPLALGPVLAAQAIQVPYDQSYSYVDLGTPAGVPGNLGGVAFKIGDPSTLYIMGAANGGGGVLHRITVTRDASRHITGFSGSSTLVATAANNDGGAQFDAGGVLFYTRYPLNELGQIKPGSSVTDKVIGLSAIGVCSSVGALSFVPAGFPNSGKLKLASYNCNTFYTLDVTPDGSGTYAVALSNVAQGKPAQGGVEGFFYVPPGSPQFTDFQSMLVCEYGSGQVTVYDLDSNGDPVLATRKLFMTGLSGAEGAAIDPLSGDFVFSTYGGSNRVIAVRGFGVPCGQVQPYGVGTAGSGGLVPQLGYTGCFARKQSVTIDVTQGLGGAPGLLLAGLQQQSVTLFGVTLLVLPLVVVNHTMSNPGGGAGAGSWSLPLTIPDDTNLLNTDFYFQSVYLDAGGPQGFTGTPGVKLQVR